MLAGKPVKHDYRVSENGLPELLKREMARREWTQSDLAHRLNKPPSMVSRWLMGQQPSTQSCDVIADTLGMDLDTILVLAGHRPSPVRFDPNDRVGELLALAKRVDWSQPGRLKTVRTILEMYLDEDRGRRP